MLFLPNYFSGRHDGMRTWNSFDWAAMERLHTKGLISDPVGKAKSVEFTDEGLPVLTSLQDGEIFLLRTTPMNLLKSFYARASRLAQDARLTREQIGEVTMLHPWDMLPSSVTDEY